VFSLETQEVLSMSDQTLAKLVRNREKLLALVADLADEQLDARLQDGWTIRETLTHVLNAEEDHCKVCAVISKGQLDRLPKSIDLDAHNAESLANRGYLNRADLFAALVAQRERTLALYHSLSVEQLELLGNHPVLGEITVGNIFRWIAVHDSWHVRDIQALLEGQN
jgi:uncharacterized damage-inducible protein DinB